MGSGDACPKCMDGRLVNGGEITLEDGTKDRIYYCYKCGATPKVEPKCTTPNSFGEPYPKEPKQAAHRIRERYGICSNCGRDNLTLYRGMCWWCNKHGYSPEEARFMVANDMIRPGVGMWHHAISKAGKAKPRKNDSTSSITLLS